MTICYYAHPKPYESEKDKRDIDIIKSQAGEGVDRTDADAEAIEVINPANINIGSDDEKLFHQTLRRYIYPEIDKCDILYYSRGRDGKISPGVKEEIKYQYQRKKPVYPVIRMMNGEERKLFYKRNPGLISYMLKFFRLKGDGNRCMAIRPFDTDIRYVYRNNLSEYNYALHSLNRLNFMNTVGYARTIEFHPYIFSDGIFKNNTTQEIWNHVIGVSLAIDIDAQDVDPDDSSKKRIDILSDDVYLEEMDMIIGTFRDELKMTGFEIDKLIFTGNGFEIMLEDFYGSLEKIYLVQDGLNGIKMDVMEKTGCNVHLKRFGWNANMKVPFTFHFDNHRLTLPLVVGKRLGMDYLVKYSDPFSGAYKLGVCE